MALLVGLPLPAYDILLKALGFILAALLVVLIFQNRGAVAQWLRGDQQSHGQQARQQRAPAGLRLLRARLADVWHILASLYVIGIYGVWAAQIPGGFDLLPAPRSFPFSSSSAVRMLVGAGDGLLRRYLLHRRELKQRFPGLEARADRYLPILVTVLHVALYAIAALILAEAWGLRAFSWLRTDTGRQIVGDLATIAITVRGRGGDLGRACRWVWNTISSAPRAEGRRGCARAGHVPWCR